MTDDTPDTADSEEFPISDDQLDMLGEAMEEEAEPDSPIREWLGPALAHDLLITTIFTLVAMPVAVVLMAGHALVVGGATPTLTAFLTEFLFFSAIMFGVLRLVSTVKCLAYYM